MICAGLAMIASWSTLAQQTVFLDTFGTSSLNQTNVSGGIPGGTASATTPYSQTSYTIGSARSALNSSVTANHLKLITAASSSANTELQARFTDYPITLATVGDYIEMVYTFTDTTNVMQAAGATSGALWAGLYYSGGVAPQSGTVLANSGFNSALTTAATGGTKDWMGYYAEMYNNIWWRIYTRPKQTTINNQNQQLFYNYPNAGAGGTSIANPGSPNLITGQPYTVQFRVTLSAPGTLIASNALYTGVGTGGAQFTNNYWTISGANVLTTNFDSLAIGYRTSGSIPWTNDIQSIKITAGLTAQAGPYFFVNSSGDPCTGLTIGLSGSVTTNDYLLYRDGNYAGPTLAGTGAALDFGAHTTPGTYTVIASNTATASTGPMFGSAKVYAPGITIDVQPASVSVVTNLPASFSVAATGSALSYQWYKGGVPLANGANISGAQTANLSIAAAQLADAGSGASGYTVVVQTPCGDIVTSTPPASLTLTAPRNLIWAGGNPGSSWNFTDPEFLLSGSPANFAQGDNATFNDSSAQTSVTISNDMTPTLVSVAGTASYTFMGPNKLTGVAQLVNSSSGTLTILNANDYTGGTIINSGSTLQLGDGANAANNGSLAGSVTVSNGATLNYSYAGSGATVITLNNTLAGSGTVNIGTLNGSVIRPKGNASSTSFSGTINVLGFTALQGTGTSGGDLFGKGSTVNIQQDGGQVWLDPQASVYDNTFNLQGVGRPDTTPALGAMRIFNTTVIGPINLLANTRIGGSITGGTLRGAISGPYQLEVLGTTIANYVLQMGPTNGTHSYSSTLITAGTIQALNNNAISSGPLTIDNAGTLRVNGNNVSVASLNSLNTGTVAGPGALVYNNHASAIGTLTVGSDNTSTTFDGIFGNGAAAALSLTKVGTGTLTLSQVSTNSGTVTVTGGTIAMTGSGAFTKASVIVGSGAFFDVTAAGGTATFGTGQTLGGSGTVNGNVAAGSGSTIAPGASVGTLTVAGNVTLGGNMVMEMNRALGQNSDRLVTSGGSITGGGTLTNVNIGAALQVGDTFQFFTSGVSGITANLQTLDLTNAVTYTWNNNIASSGSVSVASVTPIAPPTLNAVQTGNTIALSWTGPFKLQSQTNSLSVGISTNWFNYPGGTVSPVNVTINPTNKTVFYRLSLQ